jgi:hypothetical protein
MPPLRVPRGRMFPCSKNHEGNDITVDQMAVTSYL